MKEKAKACIDKHKKTIRNVVIGGIVLVATGYVSYHKGFNQCVYELNDRIISGDYRMTIKDAYRDMNLDICGCGILDNGEASFVVHDPITNSLRSAF